VRILADYLTILGFVRKDGDRYEVTPDTVTFLNRQSPAYLGGPGVLPDAEAARELCEAHRGRAARRDGGF
jgi:hypothetical protein